MTPEQMAEFKKRHRIADGQEWDRFAGLDIDPDELEAFLRSVPFAAAHRGACQRRRSRCRRRCRSAGARRRASTQEAFGRIMGELARDEGELAARIITTSPDVTVSTSLGPWVSRRSVFNRAEHADVFKQERLASSPAVGREPARPARRARHRREQPVPAARGARPVRAAVRPAPDPGRHALRPVHRARPRCAHLRELPGRALSAGRDAVRHLARARGRRPSVGRHAADRHRPAGAAQLRARLCRRAGGDPALRLRAPAERRRQLGLSAPLDADRSSSPSAR